MAGGEGFLEEDDTELGVGIGMQGFLGQSGVMWSSGGEHRQRPGCVADDRLQGHPRPRRHLGSDGAGRWAGPRVGQAWLCS